MSARKWPNFSFRRSVRRWLNYDQCIHPVNAHREGFSWLVVSGEAKAVLVEIFQRCISLRRRCDVIGGNTESLGLWFCRQKACLDCCVHIDGLVCALRPGI